MMKLPSITGMYYVGPNQPWASFPAPGATSPFGIMVQLTAERNPPNDSMTAVYLGTDNKLYTTTYAINSTKGTWSQPYAYSDVLNPVPNAAPAIASDGTHIYVVYPSGADLYYIIDGNAPVQIKIANGIAEGTSPALFSYGNPEIPYFVYQSYDGGSSTGGRLLCMAFDDSTSTWSQINPAADDFYGMSGSPSVALTEDGSFGYVIYQGYGINGLLSGSVFTSGDATQLGLQKFINSLQAFDLPVPSYMSGSPSAAVLSGMNLVVAMAPQGGTGDIRVLSSAGPDWVLPSPGEITNGSPILVSYNHLLVCFWLTSD
jgi:hypothetical protein